VRLVIWWIQKSTEVAMGVKPEVSFPQVTLPYMGVLSVTHKHSGKQHQHSDYAIIHWLKCITLVVKL